MSRIDFDAGNEWADSPSPAAAPQATPAPETDTSAEVDSPEDSPQADIPSWADQPTEDTLGVTSVKTPRVAAPTAAEIEVGGPGGKRKYKLDANDKELQQTLALGRGARKWQQERDAARKEAESLKKNQGTLREKAQVWDQLDELARLGQRTKVAHAVLGDDGYAALKAQILREHEITQNGDPDARHAYERERANEEQNFSKHMYEKKLRELEEKNQTTEDRVESDRLRSLGTSSLIKYDMRNFVEDPDLANKLNTKLWTLAWNDLEAADTDDISPEMINKAFAENAKTLRAGMRRSVDAKVNKVIEGKKQDATRRAQAAATERYPSAGQVDVSDWDGKSSKGLLRLLAGSNKR